MPPPASVPAAAKPPEGVRVPVDAVRQPVDPRGGQDPPVHCDQVPELGTLGIF